MSDQSPDVGLSVASVVDLFAGAGGWDVAAFDFGIEPLGIELDDIACLTREAAGLPTLKANAAELDPLDFGPLTGLIASPPCQAWSMAGKRAGARDQAHCVQAALDLADGSDTRAQHREACEDERSILVVEPLRWALALGPEWIALEQVPPVLDYWKLTARLLEAVGYRCWTGVLEAERYGIVATCPEHDQRSVSDAPSPLSLANLATAGRAEITVWEDWILSAENVKRRSNHAAQLVSVANAVTGPGIGSTQTEALNDAWTVANLARAAIDAASDATWRAHVRSLLSQALPARTTMRGRAAGAWMSAATSECGWMAATGENIAWSPKFFLDALCGLARSYITSTESSPITLQTTYGCSSATGTICTSITVERSRAECSLCDDMAVPQTRERAILMASRTGQLHPPRPTHQRFVSGEPARHDVTLEGEILPWVSMAEALGWGMTERPCVTVTGASESGGRHGIDGGSGARATIERERESLATASQGARECLSGTAIVDPSRNLSQRR
jgi:site-specific DNA-cytosine methylase